MDGLAGATGRDLALTLLAFLTGEPVDHGVRVVAATVDEADKVEVTLRDTTGTAAGAPPQVDKHRLAVMPAVFSPH